MQKIDNNPKKTNHYQPLKKEWFTKNYRGLEGETLKHSLGANMHLRGSFEKSFKRYLKHEAVAVVLEG